MRVTRRFWEASGVGGFLCVLAVVLQRPFLVGAAGAIAVWLFIQQYRFTHQLKHIADELSISQTISRGQVLTDEPFLVTLESSMQDVPTGIEITAHSNPPLIATTDKTEPQSVHLSREDNASATSYQVTIPTAGVVRFEHPEVVIQSAGGFFEESLRVGEATKVTVEPRTPRRIHIGEGGRQISTGYGEHTSDQRGSGIEPAEIRQYVHGDDISRIDWKATARLNKPHIRDYQVPTAQQTTLVVDHRSSTGARSVDGSELDYLREVALAFLSSAAKLDDPVGLYTVDDEGSTNIIRPQASEKQYRRLKQVLHNLSASGHDESERYIDRTQVGHARHFATEVHSDSSAFSETLDPYLRATNRYGERFGDKPLF
ncbi:DUF58 domain-containing protein, partial [Haloferax profundi]|uniref:DUF58 domain-containing protein n=1 Tax=Haloferax profundi TaxID=1544718 RepID=UPI0009EC0ADC